MIMFRRGVMFMAVLVVGLGPLQAVADVARDLARQLRREGYRDISTEQTWLGRVRISANGALGTREIIVNPLSGEVLRDIIITSQGVSLPANLAGQQQSGQSSNSGSGSTDDDDDDDDADDDSDDGDSSGSGSDGDGGGDDD